MDTSYTRLFLRFLHFGLLAWGGPVAQIDMIRHELVEEGKWISRERFNRVLGVYQLLPGPEAHELCVYFGMLAKGRIGGFLAGLGFMLPGFLLMFTLSWFYAAYGIKSPLFSGLFYGMQAAVPALIIRATHRIGGHALTDRWLWAIAVVAGVGHLLDLHFLITLSFAGVAYIFAKRRKFFPLAFVSAAFLGGSIFYLMIKGVHVIPESFDLSLEPPSSLRLFFSGLRSGLLTFGGAYTVISFLQHDAVEVGRWMTNPQFLNGVALSGILPAPFIIFSTFVGYLGGGPWGALILTIGIFLPAFGMTLIGHRTIEKVVENRSLHSLLDGVTAGVVGLIAATTAHLLKAAIIDLPSLVILGIALASLYRWKEKGTVAAVVLSAGLLGILFKQIFLGT
ncbi:MAG: chromate efflux transporter [Deltaproteobacteria bacterium]|nr:chromate efflux transporter [Deltaproteobacteria bacterium]